MDTGGEGWGATDGEPGMDAHTCLHLKQITNKDRCYGPGSAAQYSVITQVGKNLKREWVCV